MNSLHNSLFCVRFMYVAGKIENDKIVKIQLFLFTHRSLARPHNSKENHLEFNASCPNIFAYSRFSVSSTRSIYKWKVWDQKWARWELSLADTSRFSFMSHPQLLQEVRSWNIKMKVAHFWNTWSQNKHYSWGNKAI